MAPGATPEKGYARFLASQLDQADAAIFVADHAGTVAGYVSPASSLCHGRSCVTNAAMSTTSSSTTITEVTGLGRR